MHGYILGKLSITNLIKFTSSVDIEQHQPAATPVIAIYKVLMFIACIMLYIKLRSNSIKMFYYSLPGELLAPTDILYVSTTD